MSTLTHNNFRGNSICCFTIRFGVFCIILLELLQSASRICTEWQSSFQTKHWTKTKKYQSSGSGRETVHDGEKNEEHTTKWWNFFFISFSIFFVVVVVCFCIDFCLFVCSGFCLLCASLNGRFGKRRTANRDERKRKEWQMNGWILNEYWRMREGTKERLPRRLQQRCTHFCVHDIALSIPQKKSTEHSRWKCSGAILRQRWAVFSRALCLCLLCTLYSNNNQKTFISYGTREWNEDEEVRLCVYNTII